MLHAPPRAADSGTPSLPRPPLASVQVAAAPGLTGRLPSKLPIVLGCEGQFLEVRSADVMGRNDGSQGKSSSNWRVWCLGPMFSPSRVENHRMQPPCHLAASAAASTAESAACCHRSASSQPLLRDEGPVSVTDGSLQGLPLEGRGNGVSLCNLLLQCKYVRQGAEYVHFYSLSLSPAGSSVSQVDTLFSRVLIFFSL